MIKKILKKFSSKYSFSKHLENELGFIKKHELKNITVYSRDEYEIVVCSSPNIEGQESLVLNCLNEPIFRINFIPNSEIFAEILIKTAIKEYEKDT